jgi:hypothetical protein
MSYRALHRSEITNTEITSVGTGSALFLASYVAESVQATTFMGWMMAKITFAGAFIVASCDIL